VILISKTKYIIINDGKSEVHREEVTKSYSMKKGQQSEILEMAFEFKQVLELFSSKNIQTRKGGISEFVLLNT